MKNIDTFKKMTLAAVVVTAFSLTTTTVWSAGSHEDGHDGATNIGHAGTGDDVTRTIEVSLQDNFYEPEEIKVALGETIRFILTNNGEFVHEFNIGTPPMHEKHQEEMAMMVEHGVLGPDKINRNMMEMDMGDGQMMKHDDPNSELLEPGETVEIIWTFSKEASLEFACNIPGHYDSGMVGEFEFSTEIEPTS